MIIYMFACYFLFIMKYEILKSSNIDKVCPRVPNKMTF